MSRERATSNHPAMGPDGIAHDVVNASGTPSPHTMPQPRDKGGPRNPNPPGVGSKGDRTGYQIDATTGERVGQQAKADLRRAAQHPEPLVGEQTGAQLDARFEPSPAQLHARRRGAHLDAVDRAGEVLAAPVPGVHDVQVHGVHHAVQIVDDIGSRMRAERDLAWLFQGPGAVR